MPIPPAATGIVPATAVPRAPLPSPSSPPPYPPATSSRSAQLALMLLIALVVSLLAGHALFSNRSGPQSGLDPRLDLNQATREELAVLPGVGPGLAERIVAHRERHGDFQAVDELALVSGVGPRTMERLRDRLLVRVDAARGPPRIQPAPAPRPLATPSVSRQAAPLDPNSATLAQLDTLPGIGPVLAQRIVDARVLRPFEKPDDLRRVKGIGPKTLEKIRPYLAIAH